MFEEIRKAGLPAVGGTYGIGDGDQISKLLRPGNMKKEHIP